MTYNTGNNVPSTDPRDLYDNAENLDKLLNGVDPFYADRKGILRQSWAGMENDFDTSQEGRENTFTLSQADKESRFQAFLVSSGYVSKGEYAAGVVLEERNEYVAVDAATTGTTAGLYFPAGSAAVPLTLTGDWAIDLPKLALREEDVLRQELAAVSGAGLVGLSQSRLASAVAGTVQSALDTFISVHTSGAVGDGATDDTAAINALIRDVAVLGGGEIRFSPGRTYFLGGTVLLPSSIKLNLCGATLKGPGTTEGVMFRTASLVGGVVTSNIGSAADTELVRYASVFGGFIREVGLGFDLFNFVMGSSLKQLVFQNCRQAWKMQRCYYPTIEDVFASGGSDAAYPCYHFKDQSNAIVLTRVSCVMEFGFFVEGGCTAFTLNGATFEGGTKGFKFTGDCLGVAVNGGYFEAVPGTLFDVKEVGTGTFKFSGNYINYVDVILDDGASSTAGPALFGEWDSSNYLANIGGVTGGITYRGRMVVSAIKNYIEFKLQADGLADQSIPANWLSSSNTDLRKLTAKTGLDVGDFRQKAICSGSSIIPMRRGGDVGPALDGSVFFASFTHGGGVVHVDTQINFRPNSLFAKFVFTVQDGNGISQVYGDLYGANVDKRSSSAITVSAVDNGGMLRLVLGITGTLVQITGSVQICG